VRDFKSMIGARSSWRIAMIAEEQEAGDGVGGGSSMKTFLKVKANIGFVCVCVSQG